MRLTLRLFLLVVCLLGLSNDAISQLTLGFNSNGNTAGCAPYTLTFPITNVSGNPASTNYTINFGDGSPILSFTQATLPSSVSHTYTSSSCGATFQSTDNVFGATITATHPTLAPFTAGVSPIVISSLPSASVTGQAATACVGSSVSFQNISTQGIYIDPNAGYACVTDAAIYYWTISPAVGWTASAANLGSNNGFPNPSDFEVWSTGSSPLNVTFTAPGSYRVKAWIANICGLDTMSVPICVIPPPNPQFTLSPNSGCVPPNLAVNATNSTTIASAPCNTPTYNYAWSVSPASGWTYSGASNSTSVSPAFSFSQSGNYTVTLNASVNGFAGCSASNNQTLTVNQAPTVNAGLDQSACVGSSAIQLSGSPAGGVWSGPGVTPGGLFNPTSVGNFNLTYTFTPASATGCPPQSDLLVLSVTNPTAANAGLDLSVCPGIPAFQLSATPLGGTWSGTGVTSGGLFDPITPGIFTLTYSAGSGACAATDQKIITVHPFPLVSVNDPSFCIGLSASLTAVGSAGLGPYTYSWSPSTNLTATSGAIVTANPASTNNYIVTITDANFCTNTDTSTVTVNPLPVVNAGLDFAVCNVPIITQLNGSPLGGTWSGNGVTASGEFTPNGVGPEVLTYSFTNSNNCTSSDQLTISFDDPIPADAGVDQSMCIDNGDLQLNGLPITGTWSGTGVTIDGLFSPISPGDVELVFSYGSGTCLSRDTTIMSVFALPNVVLNDTVMCEGRAITLTALGSGGLAPYSYSWTPSASLSANTGAVVDANPTSTTDYTVTITDLNMCQASDVATLTVNAVPVADAGLDQTICLGPTPIQLTGSPTTGMWSGDNVTSSGFYSSVSAGIDTLIYAVSQNGCTGIDTMYIDVQVPIIVTLTPDTTICFDSGDFQLFAATPGGTWSSASATVSSSGIFTPNLIGSFVVTYSLSTGLCSQFGSLIVTVLDLPSVNAGPNFNVCFDALPSTINTGNPNVGGTWLWSGNGITDANTGLFDPSIAGNGVHSITYTFTSTATGCSASDNLNATVNALPTIQLSSAVLNICLTPFETPLTATPVGGTWSGSGLNFSNNTDSQLDSALFIPTSTGVSWVYYTYTDANSCANSDSISVSVIAPQAVNAGLDQSFCYSHSSYQLVGSPLGGSWISPTWISSAGFFSGDSLGTHQAVYSVGSGSCTVMDTVEFVVNSLPTINIGSNLESCIADPCFVLPNPSILGGTWSGSGISNTATGQFCSSAAGIGASQIIYTFQDAATTCINRDTLIVVVNSMPSPDFTVVPLFCTNSPSQVVNLSVGPTMTYEWKVRNATTNALISTLTDDSPLLNIPNAGDYSLELICRTLAGCELRDTALFTTVAPPVASFQLSDDVVCGPFQETVTNTSSGYQVSFQWDYGPLGAGSTDTIPSLPVFAAPIFADSLYYVSLDVTNMCGTRTAVDSVSVRPVPVAEIGTNYSQGCSPFSPLIQNASYGSPDWYQWDLGDGTTSTDSIPAAHNFTTVDSVTTVNITLSIGNTCGLANASTSIQVYPISLNPLSPALISGCSPLDVSFNFSLGGTSLNLWDFGDNTGMQGDSVSHIFEIPGTYQVSLSVSNICISDTLFHTVTVYPGPDLDFQIDQATVCLNSIIHVENNSSNAVDFEIDFGDGAQVLNVIASHEFNMAGVQTIWMTGENPQNGCRDTIYREVDVIPYPEIYVTANPDTGCMPLTAQFFNTTTNASGYEWHFADGTGSIIAEPTIVIPTSGDFVAQLIAHNYQGIGTDCPDTAEVTIHVFPTPSSSFSLSADTACGPPVSTSITNTSTGGETYIWNWTGNSSTVFEPTMEFQLTGSHEITLIAENSFACRDTSRNNFFVVGQPLIDLIIDPQIGCAPHTVSFANLTQYGDSVTWAFGDGQFSQLNNPVHVYEEPGVYSVELYVSSSAFCYDDSVLVEYIQVNPQAQAGLLISPEVVAESSPIINLVNESQNATIFELFLEENLISNEVPLIYTFEDADTGFVRLTLIANNEFNCADTAYSDVHIVAAPNIYVPNSFSPNADGINDGFKPFMDRIPGYYYFSIYDRWGNLIFESFDCNAHWDGTNLNSTQNEGKQDVYVYKLKAIFEQDQIYNFVGNVTLIH